MIKDKYTSLDVVHFGTIKNVYNINIYITSGEGFFIWNPSHVKTTIASEKKHTHTKSVMLICLEVVNPFCIFQIFYSN